MQKEQVGEGTREIASHPAQGWDVDRGLTTEHEALGGKDTFGKQIMSVRRWNEKSELGALA